MIFPFRLRERRPLLLWHALVLGTRWHGGGPQTTLKYLAKPCAYFSWCENGAKCGCVASYVTESLEWLVASGLVLHCLALHHVAVLEYSLEQRTPSWIAYLGAMTKEVCMWTC